MGRRAPRRGFTLVELLVSLVILGLSMVALLQLYLAASLTFQKGKYQMLANVRAQTELERLHSLGYTGLMANPLIDASRYPAGQYTALSSGSGVSFAIPELPNGQGTITITPFVTPAGVTTTNVARVVIRLTWRGVRNEQPSLQLTTIKTGPPPPSGGGGTP